MLSTWIGLNSGSSVLMHPSSQLRAAVTTTFLTVCHKPMMPAESLYSYHLHRKLLDADCFLATVSHLTVIVLTLHYLNWAIAAFVKTVEAFITRVCEKQFPTAKPAAKPC